MPELRALLFADPADPHGIAARLLDFFEERGDLDADFAMRVRTVADFRAYPLDAMGLDSLDLSELMMWLDDVFMIDLPDPVERWSTLGDVVDAVATARG